jgi:hypothetical protein
MNIVQLQEQLKNFSQDQLVREMQMPSGTAPQFLVLGEIMRRQKMQQDFSAQQAKGQPQSTVAEDAIAASGVPQGGIASMARAMAPQTDMAQSTGVQAMASGGPVKKMQAGGVAKTDPAIIAMANRLGMSVDEYLRSVGEEQATRLEESAARRSLRDRMVGMEPSGEGVTMPTQEDLDRAYNEDRFAFGASRPLVAPTADLARPDVPMMEGRLIGRSPVATPALAGLPAVADMMPRGTRRLSPEQLAAMEAAQPAVASPDAGVLPPPAAAAAETPTEFVEQFGMESYDPDTPSPGVMERIFGAPALERIGVETSRTAAAEEDALPMDTGTPLTVEDAKIAAEQAADVVTQPTAPSGGAGGGGAGGGGAGGAGGAGGGIASAGGMSSFEQELMDALGRREKAAEQDKWLALAQVGLNMMSSTQPTLLGAVGEAGLKGVEAARSARDQYDKDRLDLMGAIEQARQARAAAVSRAAGGGGGLANIKPINATILKQYLDEIAAAKSELGMLQPPSEPSFWTGAIDDPDAAKREALQDRIAALENAAAYAYATHGAPYVGSGAGPTGELDANLSD